jgi:sterol desaturase/sphingolipid hydroxylase (fatty acid hydroxylase superfamily)
MHPAYILLAIPVFFLAMGVEWLYGYSKKKNWYRLNDSVTNIIIGLGQQLSSLLSKAFLFGVYVWFYNHYSFYKIPATWWSFVLCLIAFDFFFYWAHRWGHEMNIFWGAHSVHHQSEEYNLSVALRQSWFHSMLAFVIFLPIPMMGFDPVIFGAAAVTHTLYQFWIHTKAIGKLHPWVEFWINTPSHHRVHHAINPKYIDKNHAGVFMIWDRMFGTFKEEESADEITYGITTQLKSWNPAWANIHYYIEMFQKAVKMKWADRFKMIFAKPGWLPDYLGGFQTVKEIDRNTYAKYDTETNMRFKIYAAAQFFIMLVCGILYMSHFKEISHFYKVVFLLLILISMLITGAILENKRWVVYAEYARLVLVMVSLNTFYYYWYINWFNLTMLVSSLAFAGCVVLLTLALLQLKQTQVAVPAKID